MQSSVNADPPQGSDVSSLAWKSTGHLFRFNPHLDDGSPTTIDPMTRASLRWNDAFGWTAGRRNVLMANDVISAQIYSYESSSHRWVVCEIIGFDLEDSEHPLRLSAHRPGRGVTITGQKPPDIVRLGQSRE